MRAVDEPVEERVAMEVGVLTPVSTSDTACSSACTTAVGYIEMHNFSILYLDHIETADSSWNQCAPVGAW